RPERLMPWRRAECRESLRAPELDVAMQMHHAIRQPRDVTRQRLELDVETDRFEQLSAHATALEVDERRRADVEREATLPEEARAASDLAVTFEHERREALRLEPCGGRESGHAAADDAYVICPVGYHGTLRGTTPARAKCGARRRE